MSSKKAKKSWGLFEVSVVRVHDGDTVTLTIDKWPKEHWTGRCRLSGIDAPEIEGPQAEAGKKSRDWLEKTLTGGPMVVVRVHGYGDFGRLLVTLYQVPVGRSINQQMVDLGLAETWKQHEKEQRQGTEDLP